MRIYKTNNKQNKKRKEEEKFAYLRDCRNIYFVLVLIVICIFIDIINKMSKLLLSYIFKTNLAAFRSAILDENTDKICRILDFERDFLNKDIDSEGNTALLLAIQYTSPLTVRLLLDHGAQPDQPNAISFQTPLGLLASKVYDDYYSYKAQRTLEMTKILLDYGAYVDKPQPCIYKDEHYKDYTGKETPLMKAVRKRNLPLVKLLIERKANVNYIERQSQIRWYIYI